MYILFKPNFVSGVVQFSTLEINVVYVVAGFVIAELSV